MGLYNTWSSATVFFHLASRFKVHPWCSMNHCYSIFSLQIGNAVSLTAVTMPYSNYIPRAYLYYNWKVMPFDHLCLRTASHRWLGQSSLGRAPWRKVTPSRRSGRERPPGSPGRGHAQAQQHRLRPEHRPAAMLAGGLLPRHPAEAPRGLKFFLFLSYKDLDKEASGGGCLLNPKRVHLFGARAKQIWDAEAGR